MIILSIIVVLLLCDLALFISDRYIASFFLLVATVAGAWYFIPEIAVLVQTHGIMELIGGYLAIGLGVATIKWFVANASLWLKLRNARSEFNDTPDSKLDNVAARHAAFASYWNNYYGRYGSSLVPSVHTTRIETFENNPTLLVDDLTLRANKHIERISFWVLQWPVVIIATALEDLLINLGRNVARLFDFLFTQFSRRLVASTVKDL